MSIKDDYQEYKNALNELKINSKPLINFLTMLAEEKIYNAPQIVRAIEERIVETKGDAVLHVLYVLDSIVKNLRSPIYVQLFEQKLPVLFAAAFNKVDERTRSAMFKLRQTWTPFFSNASLHNLDTRTNYIDPAWPITARVVTNSSAEETKTRDDNYQMIPIERTRVDHEHSDNVLDTNQIKTDEKEVPNNESFSENLFGGRDIDYRENNGNSTTDSDSIFELNNKCFSLAEEKYKSKELSTEQYQATLKLLQEILENEARRLTTNTTTNSTSSSFLRNPNNSLTTMGPNSSNSQFANQPFVQFANNFPMTGFANETQRHAMQILATVGASFPYTSAPFNLLPYLPPLPPAPPAPPSFTLLSATFPTTNPPQAAKRAHDETPEEQNPIDNEPKRKREEYTTTSNFDEENIAPVPSLVDANLNTLKKKYLGVIQQLYIGKYQCRSCGLRFTMKQRSSYTAHLDWHFWENQQASAAAARSQSSREWFPSLVEWMTCEENSNEKYRNQNLLSKQARSAKDNQTDFSVGDSSSQVISCPAANSDDPDDDRCFVCRDQFENFFDHHREEWHFKDAIRVNGKTYHVVCYNDSKNHVTSDQTKNSPDQTNRSQETSNNHQSYSQHVEKAMATANIKSEHEEDSNDADGSSSDESSKPNYLSSVSFVNLIESIFVKKEDLKPIENLATVSTSVTEDRIDPTNMSEEIPFLSIKREAECEF